MPTISVPRPNVTVEEVSNILRDKLGSRYQITPSVTGKGFFKEVPDDANTMLVKGNRLERANLRVDSGAHNTEIHVSPGATYPGLIRLIDRIGMARRVRQILENATELAGSN